MSLSRWSRWSTWSRSSEWSGWLECSGVPGVPGDPGGPGGQDDHPRWDVFRKYMVFMVQTIKSLRKVEISHPWRTDERADESRKLAKRAVDQKLQKQVYVVEAWKKERIFHWFTARIFKSFCYVTKPKFPNSRIKTFSLIIFAIIKIFTYVM